MRATGWLGLAPLAAVIGCGVWLYAPDKRAADLEATYHVAPGDYRSVDGLRLRLKDTGPADAPAVILLHGFGASLETWEPWARRLAADHRVIRLDLPGFGLTGPDPQADYSDERILRVLRDLMDQLGLKRASLVGHSLGGRIAWRFASANPARVDKLVLISPDGFASPGFEYGKRPKLPMLMRVLPYTLPRSLLRINLAAAYGDPKALDEASLTRYRDMLLAPGVRGAILARTEQVMLTDPAPRLRQIQAPTLLLWGERDGMIPFANARDYLRNIPNAVLAALPGLGHVPFEEAPDAAIEPVLRFLGPNGQAPGGQG